MMPKPRFLDALNATDKRLDHLLDLLHFEDDHELDEWAVHSLAGGIGLTAVVVDGDDVKMAHRFGKMFLMTLTTAGLDRATYPTPEILHLLRQHIVELQETVDFLSDQRRWNKRSISPSPPSSNSQGLQRCDAHLRRRSVRRPEL